jgi:hypothetical protein
MAGKSVWRLVVGLGVVAAFLTVGSSGALAQSQVQHGIGFTKGCASPTKVGDPYTCTYTIRNVLDEAQDTLTISQIVDVVHAAAPVGDQTSSTVLDSAPVTPSGGASCTAPPNRTCTIPFGGRVDVGPFSFYTVHGSDFTGANPLQDAASLTWHDLCDDPAHTGDQNCVQNPPTVGAASQSTIAQRASQTATTIHDAGHNPVTTVANGQVVHDFVAVTTNDPSPLQGTPSGNVVLSFFANNQCTGNAAATSGPILLGANGTVDATGFPQGPLAPGFYGFQAAYQGDGTYAPSTGPCEPLQVVDANIQITPQLATNPVGANHVFTGHVNVNDGSGPANAPDGTQISFTIDSGPGNFTTPNPCTTSGGTGSCSITLVSSTPGTTVVSAHTTVTVGGLSLTRDTNGSGANSGPATKLWADDTIVTHVRDAANNDVTNTTVTSGTIVHDEATVAKAAGTPAAAPDPTGTVTFTLFQSSDCTGTVLGTDANRPLAGGTATSSNFTTPDAGGLFSYRAHYNGDPNYPAHDAACEPFQVNAVQGQGRITGGGSIFDTVDGVPNTRITHGFELRCDPSDPRQSLEINWAGGNNFHLEKLINSVVCFDDPTTQPAPPPGTVFDTYAGNTLFNGHTGYHGFGYAVGTGICNKLPATIYFILIDAGEPGTGDVAEYHITGGCTLNVGPKFLTFGNHQFHKR